MSVAFRSAEGDTYFRADPKLLWPRHKTVQTGVASFARIFYYLAARLDFVSKVGGSAQDLFPGHRACFVKEDEHEFSQDGRCSYRVARGHVRGVLGDQ